MGGGHSPVRLKVQQLLRWLMEYTGVLDGSLTPVRDCSVHHPLCARTGHPPWFCLSLTVKAVTSRTLTTYVTKRPALLFICNVPGQTQMDRMREDAGWGTLHSPLPVSSLSNGTLADMGPPDTEPLKSPLLSLRNLCPVS